MKAVICDECNRQVSQTEYGLAPNGWVSVDVRGEHKPALDYCSRSCAVFAFERLEAAKARARLIEQRSSEMAATEIALTDTEQAF